MARQDSHSHRHAESRSYESRRRDDDRYSRDSRRDRDRYDDRSQRPRSRERRRSRSPEVDRDRRRSRDRDRDREQEYRRRDDNRRRDPSRDRDRRRRSPPRDLPPKPDSRASASQSNRATPTPTKEDEQAKRRAKLEAWKAKQLAKNESKAKEAASSDPVKTIMDDIRSTSGTPAAMSPPASITPSAVDSPKPHAKFDPKAVIKKATYGASNKGALGLDVSLPAPATKSATANNFQANSAANTNKAANATSKPGLTNGSKTAGKVSGFGLAAGQGSDNTSKIALDLEDEKENERKLEKLQIPLSEDQDEDAALANGQEDEDDSPVADEDDHEAALKALEARRAAAEGAEAPIKQDTTMEDGPDTTVIVQQEDQLMTDAGAQAEEEDVDPLDAFMDGLSAAPVSTLPTFSSLRSRRGGPEAIFAEESAYDEVHGEAEDDVLAVAQRKKAKKELKKIDHKKVDYEDFQKNFYTESEETKDLTEEEVANLRFEMEQIGVRGKDVPKPVERWSAMGLSVQTQQVISSLGYIKPTPIQAQAIPCIMSGRDLIGVAKTGSGKTMAFLLPMFRHIKAQRPLSTHKLLGSEGPVAVVLAPTRELADQIGRECKPFAKALGLKVAICFGQASLKDNIDKIKLGVEIIVATPGRLIDLATVNSGSLLSFKRVTYMVLDEADRLWDMGFAPQVKMILSQIRPDRQFVMFSATFPNNLEVLAKEMLKDKPVQITIGGRATVAPEIELQVEVLDRSERLKKLLEILGNKYADADWSPLNRDLWDDQTLIFVERQEAATELLGALMKRGFTKISYIHGSREQDERVAAITDFKNGHYPILIATSIAARGLDVKNLKLVLNYDVPRHLEDFVHRAGRTGRAGNTGTCITFLTTEDQPYAADVLKAFKYSDREVPLKVEEMANAYRQKIKKGEVRYTTKGFGGHGVEKFDAARDLERTILKKQAGLDEKKAEDYKDPEEEGGEADIAIKVQARDDSKKEDKIDTPKDTSVAADSPKPTAEAPPSKAKTTDPYANLDEYNIKVHKRIIEPTPALPADPLARARAKAAEISGRKTGVAPAAGGAVSAGHNRDNKGPDAGAFHATLEINDYPQKARWAVTNRTNVKNILDQYSVSITSKGVFYKLGEGPKTEAELPKLYLLVEGDTENSVMGAMRDLVRLLKEGIVQDLESAARQPRVAGRYSLI